MRNAQRDTWAKDAHPNIRVLHFTSHRHLAKDGVLLFTVETGKDKRFPLTNLLPWVMQHMEFDGLLVCRESDYVRLDRLDSLMHSDLSAKGSYDACMVFANRKCCSMGVSALERAQRDDRLACWQTQRLSHEGNDIVAFRPWTMIGIRMAHRLQKAVPLATGAFRTESWADRIEFYEGGTFSRYSYFTPGSWWKNGDELVLDYWEDGEEKLRAVPGGWAGPVTTGAMQPGSLPDRARQELAEVPYDPERHCIVFRFHDRFEAAKERLMLLRGFNPLCRLRVIYGGPEEFAKEAEEAVRGLHDGFYYPEFYRSTTSGWLKWAQPGLLGIRQWWRDAGKDIDADFFHFHESDILAVGPMNEMYRKFYSNAVISGERRPADNMNWQWQFADHNERPLVKWVKDNGGDYPPLHYHVFAGSVFPAAFLRQMEQSVPMEMGVSDEMDTAMLAALFGYRIVQLGNDHFGAWPWGADRETIEHQISVGKKFFHAVKDLFFSKQELDHILETSSFMKPSTWYSHAEKKQRLEAAGWWSTAWASAKRLPVEREVPVIDVLPETPAEKVTVVFSGGADYLDKITWVLCGIAENTKAKVEVVYVSFKKPSDTELQQMDELCAKHGMVFRYVKDLENLKGTAVARYEATWCRVRLPWLLPDRNIVIQLDPDILVREDIARLANILPEGCPMAASRDWGYNLMDFRRESLAKFTHTGTINAGVVVMDLRWFREHWAYAPNREFFLSITKELGCPEQQFWTVMLHERIHYINPRISENNVGYTAQHKPDYSDEDLDCAFNSLFFHAVWSKPWSAGEGHVPLWRRCEERFRLGSKPLPKRNVPALDADTEFVFLIDVDDGGSAVKVQRMLAFHEEEAQGGRYKCGFRLTGAAGSGADYESLSKSAFRLDAARFLSALKRTMTEAPNAHVYLADKDAFFLAGSIMDLVTPGTVLTGKGATIEQVPGPFPAEIGCGILIPNDVLRKLVLETPVNKRPGWWIAETAEKLGFKVMAGEGMVAYCTSPVHYASAFWPFDWLLARRAKGLRLTAAL